MDHKFTEQIRQWLETPEDERDYAVGAIYLLKLSGNQIMYKNIISQIDRRHDFVEYQLQKYYNFRVQALTHAQVEEMAAHVQTIADEGGVCRNWLLRHTLLFFSRSSDNLSSGGFLRIFPKKAFRNQEKTGYMQKQSKKRRISPVFCLFRHY